MKNESLKSFKEFPKNFLDWILEFSNSLPVEYSLEEAKEIYKNNSEKDLGFIYRRYTPKAASVNNAWYDEQNFIPEINIEVRSIGKSVIFFGSINEYKDLLNKLIVSQSIGGKSYYNLKEFYQFGKIYLFRFNAIKYPMDIFN